ncbi:tryptophanyl-tRNA synthetase [Endobacter medicaginis]|uniref:Tryptophan--tRNA ligase n=1 Tax=Endobacter medicaginis TaxID=1181271 RepID=A0A839US16_9PROT|nr:tryptophan--tRNA ligase [Endobacter medicaginis]MBB3173038.1 tryptophanyl-tRNA synthetase [Endobacter medicaginis]MCX5474537.1 tryptophan--tRNA ligase [Endobacter medicaginis]
MARIFSGIQPTGIPTLGNYLGAIRNWVTLQAEHECIFCLVDLHAITQFQDPATLARQTREQAAVLLACGIDPAGHIFFNQSAVSAHARLAWIFNCVARLGWLNRMTQFKDKAGKDREAQSAGLYVYPNLMAADILAYHATQVPVGDDQRQHVELTNDIAQKFNHDYGVDFFPEVAALIPPTAARVMSLRDGTKKMSKSDPSDQSRINLTDDADQIALKIRRAKTDPKPLPADPAGLEGRAEARNLIDIYTALSGETRQGVLDRFGGGGFGPFKEALAAVLVEHLAPIAAETQRLLRDETAIDAVLRDGAGRAGAVAEPIVREAERLVGFLR